MAYDTASDEDVGSEPPMVGFPFYTLKFSEKCELGSCILYLLFNSLC